MHIAAVVKRLEAKRAEVQSKRVELIGVRASHDAVPCAGAWAWAVCACCRVWLRGCNCVDAVSDIYTCILEANSRTLVGAGCFSHGLHTLLRVMRRLVRTTCACCHCSR